MTYEEFLHRIIEDGLVAAKTDYKEEDSRREGAVAGFEACRGKNPVELMELLTRCQEGSKKMLMESHDEDTWWYSRAYEAEVEWVCNAVSAALMNQGLPVIVAPTARGVMKAAELLGVGGPQEPMLPS